MQPVSHVLEYYRTKLAWADAADWPHVHLREQIRHYEILNARTSLRDELNDVPFDPPYKIVKRKHKASNHGSRHQRKS